VALRAKTAVLRARGDWTEAEAVLRRVLTLQPTEANRHHELGQILMAEGRHQEALASFQTARRFAGGTDPVYSYDANIAMAYPAIGQFAQAIAIARLAIGEMPPNIGRLAELPWLALLAVAAGTRQRHAPICGSSRSYHGAGVTFWRCGSGQRLPPIPSCSRACVAPA
jgi:Flp pilus assembly protein TadD